MMVIIAERIHLFPFRTQQLSSHTSTIFGWRRPEKIDRCHQPDKNPFDTGSFFSLFLVSSQIEKGSHKANALKGRGITEQKMNLRTREQMIKSESYDEETARENKAMRKRHALNQDRCYQPASQLILWLVAIFLF